MTADEALLVARVAFPECKAEIRNFLGPVVVVTWKEGQHFGDSLDFESLDGLAKAERALIERGHGRMYGYQLRRTMEMHWPGDEGNIALYATASIASRQRALVAACREISDGK